MESYRRSSRRASRLPARTSESCGITARFFNDSGPNPVRIKAVPSGTGSAYPIPINSGVLSVSAWADATLRTVIAPYFFGAGLSCPLSIQALDNGLTAYRPRGGPNRSPRPGRWQGPGGGLFEDG